MFLVCWRIKVARYINELEGLPEFDSGSVQPKEYLPCCNLHEYEMAGVYHREKAGQLNVNPTEV